MAARNEIFNYLTDLERHYFNTYSELDLKYKHICEKNNAKECIRVLKNIIRTENEKLTGFSALKILKKVAQGSLEDTSALKPGFIMEVIF
ncbi:MAG: hypothetical protein PHY99_04000, partial [Bacteroidales bacterium]|nr:hypothetical protein [Bacteroidales bacterium]